MACRDESHGIMSKKGQAHWEEDIIWDSDSPEVKLRKIARQAEKDKENKNADSGD